MAGQDVAEQERIDPRPGPASPLVALIVDVERPYDRLIIGGVAQYARERGGWSLYVEEDPLQKIPDLSLWHGQGIIANFDDRSVARALHGLRIPVVGVGGGFGWYEPDSGTPYIFTDNRAIGQLGAEHLLTCGFEHLAFYGYPRTSTSGWSDERARAFTAACRAAGREPHSFSGRHATARRWAELQRELCGWLAALPKPVGLMACNDVQMICDLTEPPLSSVDQSARRIGYQAAATLDQLMRPETAAGSPPQRVVVPPIGVVTRASTDTMATSDEVVTHALERLRADPWRKPDIAALASEACVSRSTLENR